MEPHRRRTATDATKAIAVISALQKDYDGEAGQKELYVRSPRRRLLFVTDFPVTLRSRLAESTAAE